MREPTYTPVRAEAASRVQKYYQLVDEGEIEALVDLFAPDAVYKRPGYDPLVGRNALTRFYSETRVIREGSHVLDTVVAASDQVAVHGTFRGTLNDGRRVELRFADFFELDPSNRFTRRDTFFFAPLV